MRLSPARLAEIFDLVRGLGFDPRYNIPPTAEVVTIRKGDEGRFPSLMKWGLIPSWSKDPKVGARMINARGETVAEKPSFRSPFKSKRCIIPASGYYEWKTEGKFKRPFHVHRPGDKPLAFAGLWDVWKPGDSDPVESCTIITTAAGPEIDWLHDRMPVMLEPQDFDAWLDPGNHDVEGLQKLLRPYPEPLDVEEVSDYVNNVRNKGPECLDPPAAG